MYTKVVLESPTEFLQALQNGGRIPNTEVTITGELSLSMDKRLVTLSDPQVEFSYLLFDFMREALRLGFNFSGLKLGV